MDEQDFPSSVVLADEFLSQCHIVWFAEDVYVYSHAAGIYEKKSGEWLENAVLLFLAQSFGSQQVDAPLVSRVCKAVKNLAYLDERYHPPISLDTLKPADVFVTSNGIVSIDAVASGTSPVLLPHNPNVFAVCGVPYSYEPTAVCPKWLEFVRWMVVGNEDEVLLLQQFCAWVFIACQLKLEKFLWLCGPGRNGKSTFLQIVRWVFGERATSTVGMDAFQGGAAFKLWPTVHKLANICSDAVVRRSSDVAGLNSFVSSDPFTVNRKFREQITIEPTTVCFFASNPMPLLDDPSDAFWRRLLLIRCDQRLAEEQVNPTLIKELKDEAPGILNWMLSAIPIVLQRRRFDIPASVLRNVEALKAEVNSARQFINEKLEVGNITHDFLSRDLLMTTYGGWCKLNLAKEVAFDTVKNEVRLAFGTELRRSRRGEHRERESGRSRLYGWKGIRWKEDEEPSKSPRDRLLDHLQEKLAERDAEIRQLRSEVTHHEPVKDEPATRHTTKLGDGETVPSSSVQSSPDLDDGISPDDIQDLLAQLSSKDTIITTSAGEEGSNNG
jgi:P4 family phage/plasmid primase-like protien